MRQSSLNWTEEWVGATKQWVARTASVVLYACYSGFKDTWDWSCDSWHDTKGTKIGAQLAAEEFAAQMLSRQLSILEYDDD